MSAPLLFDSDHYAGGLTGAGWSIPYTAGAYSGSITINIPPGSTIRKAYLIAGRVGNATVLVTFNGSPAPFNPSNAVVPNFQSIYGGNSNVHIRDVTSLVSPTQNTYTISTNNQPGSNNRFPDFYLYVKYNNPAFSFINTYLFINRDNFTAPGIQSYPLLFAFPINTAFPVNLSGMLGYVCNNVNGGDGTHVSVNGTPLGGVNSRIGAPNPNSPNYPTGLCQGPHGDFAHGNGILTGLNGCSNDIAMGGAIPYDVVSDIRTLLANNATGFTVGVTPEVVGNDSNSTWAWFVSYNDNNEIYECAACGTYAVTNLLSTSARLNWSSCVPHIPADAIKLSLTYNTITPFQVGETVTGGTSVATGTVLSVSANSIQVNNISGTFQLFETVTGGTSGASATVTNIQLPSFVNLIQWRPVTSATWIQQTVTNVNFLDISGLTSGVQYVWQVVNQDTDGARCAPSAFQYFTTP